MVSFGQASFLPFLLRNILSFSKSLPPSLNHFNHALNAEPKQKSHETAHVSDEAAEVVYYILLLLIITVIDIVNVEMQCSP